MVFPWATTKEMGMKQKEWYATRRKNDTIKENFAFSEKKVLCPCFKDLIHSKEINAKKPTVSQE